MNTKASSNFTLFQDRNLNGLTYPPIKPARFSSEPEGEGLEVCLRGLLMACLVAALTITGAHLGNVATAPGRQPALPDAHTAVACVQPATAPVAKAL